MRYLSEMRRAEQYAADELGWRNAEAVEARAAGRDERAVAVLIDPGVHSGGPGRFVIAYDEADRLATDAGEPTEFGFRGA